MNHDELPEFIKNSIRTSGVQYFNNNYSGDSRKFSIWYTGLKLSYTNLFGVIQSVVIKYFDGYIPKQDIFFVDGRVIKLTTDGANILNQPPN